MSPMESHNIPPQLDTKSTVQYKASFEELRDQDSHQDLGVGKDFKAANLGWLVSFVFSFHRQSPKENLTYGMLSSLGRI